MWVLLLTPLCVWTGDAVAVRFAAPGAMKNMTQCRFVVHTPEQYEAARQLQHIDSMGAGSISATDTDAAKNARNHARVSVIRSHMKDLKNIPGRATTSGIAQDHNDHHEESIQLLTANAEKEAVHNRYEFVSTQLLLGAVCFDAVCGTVSLRVPFSEIIAVHAGDAARAKGGLW